MMISIELPTDGQTKLSPMQRAVALLGGLVLRVHIHREREYLVRILRGCIAYSDFGVERLLEWHFDNAREVFSEGLDVTLVAPSISFAKAVKLAAEHEGDIVVG